MLVWLCLENEVCMNKSKKYLLSCICCFFTVLPFAALDAYGENSFSVDAQKGEWNIASGGERMEGLAIRVNGINVLKSARPDGARYVSRSDALECISEFTKEHGTWVQVKLSVCNVTTNTVNIDSVDFFSCGTSNLLKGVAEKDLRIHRESNFQHDPRLGIYPEADSYYVSALLATGARERAWVFGYKPPQLWTSKFELSRSAGNVGRFRAFVEFNGKPFPLEPGEKIELDPLLLSAEFSLVNGLQSFGSFYRVRTPVNKTSQWSGFNTWECFLGGINISKTRGLVDFFENSPAVKGRINALCLDDGWQITRGNWYPDAKKYPGGLEEFVSLCCKAGIVPGLWLAPVWGDEATVKKLGLITTGKHDSLPVLYLDPTDPALRGYVYGRLRELRKQGVRYFKTDFMDTGYLKDRGYANSKMPPERVLRDFCEGMREAMGPDSFWLGCGAVIAPMAGLVDGCRIFTDVSCKWSTVNWIIQVTGHRFWMHGNLWINDSDFLIVKGTTQYKPEIAGEPRGFRSDTPEPGLTYEQAKTWATVLLVSGGLVTWSDNPAVVNDRGMELVRKVLEHGGGQGGVPLDLGVSSSPTKWVRREADRVYIALVNVSDEKKEIVINSSEVPELVKAGNAVEVFSGADTKLQNGEIRVLLEPNASHCYIVRR